MRTLADSLFWCVGKLPPRVALALGVSLGWLLHRVLRFRRRIVTSQVAASLPDLSAAERQRLVQRIYRHLGLVVVETVRLPYTSAETLARQVEFHGMEHVDAALARGKGLLAVSGHFGNWELSMAAIARRGYPLHTIVKEIKSATGQYAVDRIRGTHGVPLIPRRNSIFQILRELRKNAMIGFVLDQNVIRDEGVFVEFFGRPACTMPALAILAQRVGTPVVAVYFHRDEHDPLRHHVTVLPEIPWEEVSADPQENIRHNTQRYTRVLEDIIRRHPDQWLWIHRRWKTQPAEPTPSGAPSSQEGR